MEERMESVLGLAQECKEFIDGVARKMTPVTMLDYPTFMKYFEVVDLKKLWVNFTWEEGKDSLDNILKITFAEQNIDDILKNINAGNYPKIMATIMAINGIEFKKQGTDDEKNVKGV